MAYRFNSGKGGITCDRCNLLFCEGFNFNEYEKLYGKSKEDNGGMDLCKECIRKLKECKKCILYKKCKNEQ